MQLVVLLFAFLRIYFIYLTSTLSSSSPVLCGAVYYIEIELKVFFVIKIISFIPDERSYVAQVCEQNELGKEFII
uniref:Putative secreted peptide n=1 Tax=Anopheles braziliensis TaxID=58242 RepID=A0A2M3ZPA6_9DIPT